MTSPCPVCGTPAETGNSGDGRQIRCPRCGPYTITGTARAMLGSRLDDDELAYARISYAIRHQTSEDDWLRIDSANLDRLVETSLPPMAGQTINLLQWVADEVGEDRLATVPIDPVAIAASVGVTEPARIEPLIDHLAEQGLVVSSEGELRLTPQGWERLSVPATSEARPVLVAGDMPIETGDCPSCGLGRRADRVASHSEVHQAAGDPTYETETLGILRCRGCNTLYIRRDRVFSEDQDHEQDPVTGAWVTVAVPRTTFWPALAMRTPPPWLAQVQDATMRQLIDETYAALNAQLRTLAAMGVRAMLDRTFELAGADPASGFEQKLRELTAAGVISVQDRETLTVMTDAGSAASHRGWCPDPEALNTILDAAEAVLHRVAVQPGDAQRLRAVVPARPRRRPRPAP